jgi:hypothetical protein
MGNRSAVQHEPALRRIRWYHSPAACRTRIPHRTVSVARSGHCSTAQSPRISRRCCRRQGSRPNRDSDFRSTSPALLDTEVLVPKLPADRMRRAFGCWRHDKHRWQQQLVVRLRLLERIAQKAQLQQVGKPRWARASAPPRWAAGRTKVVIQGRSVDPPILGGRCARTIPIRSHWRSPRSLVACGEASRQPVTP